MSIRTIRITLRDYNRDLLHRELLLVLPANLNLNTVGFEKVADRLYKPRSEPIIRKGPLVNGTHPDRRTIQPGELWVTTDLDLTAQEAIDLDATLAAHDETQRSRSQIRADDHDADFAQLAAEERGWDALTDKQQLSALRRLLRTRLRENGLL